MELLLNSGILLGCAAILYVSGEWVVHGLMRLSRLLHVREFVVAFFVMAMASSLPNLFVGVTSAIGGIPELSLGDVFGDNLIAMTLAVAAAVFFSKSGKIEAHSMTVRTSMLYTVGAVILPLVLIADGYLGRLDAVILFSLFFLYVRWLLTQHGRFSKPYNHVPSPVRTEFLKHTKLAIKDTLLIVMGVVLLIVAAYGLVSSATFFAAQFNIPIFLIGLLVVGLGNALPEVYFSVLSARRGDTALIMGNLMGSIIVPATLVLGTTALISPIQVDASITLAGTRAFVLAAAILFYIFAATRHHIGRVEAIILSLVYVAFVVWVISTTA